MARDLNHIFRTDRVAESRGFGIRLGTKNTLSYSFAVADIEKNDSVEEIWVDRGCLLRVYTRIRSTQT